MEPRNYFAFISYRREGVDEKVTNWIHRKLEKYPYPKDKENTTHIFKRKTIYSYPCVLHLS